MNQGRIWCVVNPTVGLPLFLGGVATISLLVHASVMSHTNWVGRFWQGGAKAKTADSGSIRPTVVGQSQSAPGFNFTVQSMTPVEGSSQPSFVIVVTPVNPAAANAQVAPASGGVTGPPGVTKSAALTVPASD